jgi:hypothetical protein
MEMFMELLVGYGSEIAYASALATAATFITGLLFFAVGGAMGPLNDIASVIQIILMAAVAMIVHHIARTWFPGISMIALVILLICAIVAIIAQIALIFRLIAFEQNIHIVLSAGIGFSLWLLIVGGMSFRIETFHLVLALLATVAGFAFIALAIGFWRGGQNHPLFVIGSIVALIAYTGWAWLLARVVDKA